MMLEQLYLMATAFCIWMLRSRSHLHMKMALFALTWPWLEYQRDVTRPWMATMEGLY